MSEVRMTPSVQSAAVPSTSSKGAVEGPAELNRSEAPARDEKKELSKVSDSAKPSDPETVKRAMDSVSGYVQSINRDLQFTVDEESKRTVIKVFDGSSGELIRQIPEEVFLELARKLNEDGELQLINALS